MLHYRGGRAAIDQPPIPRWMRSGTTSPRSTGQEIAGLAALGCTYLQLDDTSLAYLNDPAQRAYVTSIGGDGEQPASDQHPLDQRRRSPASPLA